MREDLDPVRNLILRLVIRHETTLAAVSRAIGRNHAYLHQFINRKTPRRLPEDVRHALAAHLGIDERSLADPLAPRSRPVVELASHGQTASPGLRRLATFPARLSVARAESPFDTPSAFARAADIDRDRYRELEDGEAEPTLGELFRIYQVSKKPLDWLIRGEDGTEVAAGELVPSDVERSLAPEGFTEGESQPAAARRKRG
ncbi:MAG: hypothetical protein GVY13_14595 [Alphaproteobacteria bacterium]|jgi:transcriptional regulator with XRE-family HTH domain|nr:hypothetical protein [Alphaproteobacteria bacterium]